MGDEASNREQRHRRGQGWKFTFLGGTPEKEVEQGNRAEFAPELTESEWRMKQVFPLSATKVGDRVVINQILSGKGMIHRLSQMGLTLGLEVQVISKTKSGSVIIGIRSEQIGLGAAMAHQVMVILAAGGS
ncbi:MAG: FeoA family protein [Xenococcaceae cyanobacterium MO_207.B15]|nr:FeoA family protein [Xenococcaceae cyanobacterium MO_207.B15]